VPGVPGSQRLGASGVGGPPQKWGCSPLAPPLCAAAPQGYLPLPSVPSIRRAVSAGEPWPLGALHQVVRFPPHHTACQRVDHEPSGAEPGDVCCRMGSGPHARSCLRRLRRTMSRVSTKEWWCFHRMTVLCLWQALTTYRCWDRLKITGGRELSGFGPTQPLSCYLSAYDFLPALTSLLRFLTVLWRIILTCA